MSIELADTGKLHLTKNPTEDKNSYLQIKKVDDRAQYKEMVKQLKELTPMKAKGRFKLPKSKPASARDLYLGMKKSSL